VTLGIGTGATFPKLKETEVAWAPHIVRLECATIGACKSPSETATKMGHWNAFPDYFGLGPMSKGWDWEAWEAKGLPRSGELQMQLVVTQGGGLVGGQ
jgi:hypothetical protein